MCNCNRRHKQITSAVLAATQEERARQSAMAAIENAGGVVYEDTPVIESAPTPTTTVTPTVKTTTVKKKS